MSFSDLSALFSKTAIRARVVSLTVVAALTACAVCAADAASSNPSDFKTMRYLAPVSPDWIDDSSPPSFASRFAQPQSSMMREIIDRSVYTLPPTPAAARPPRSTDIIPGGTPILGMASMYNPNDANDPDAGNLETASGELYNVNDWTAAVRTDLRAQFGGVRFGKNYRPAFALVQSGDKQVIVRINDVGPLMPGRIIDLNERAMRYFDPTLQQGLLRDARVTPLSGTAYAAGPVVNEQPITVVSFDRR